MNPEQKRNPMLGWITGLILFTLTFWAVSGSMGRAIQQKSEKFYRANRIIEKKISSVSRQADGLQNTNSVSVIRKINSAQLYSIIIQAAEQTGMIIENYSWHKADNSQNSQTSPQASEMTAEINITGNYPNFTRFLLILSGNPEYQLIQNIVLTSNREAGQPSKTTIRATIKMIIPN